MDWFLHDNGHRHERVKIFLGDLFCILNGVDIASNDKTRYVVVGDISEVITSSEKSSKALLKWFRNNSFKK